MTVVARVTHLHRTAIKGFGVTSEPFLELSAAGARADREFFMVDEADKLFSVTRTGAFLDHWSRYLPSERLLEIGRGEETLFAETIDRGEPATGRFFADRAVHGFLVAGPIVDRLSELAGRQVRLIKTEQPTGGVDVEPLTLHSEASVADLGTEVDGSVLDARRFRLNLTLDAGPTPYVEDTWSGSRLGVGGAELVVGRPVPRCAAVQRHPDDGGRGVNVLKRIRERRSGEAQPESIDLGVYAQVVTPGRVSVGDQVQLLG
ncbi:MOSC domain-containing protein [Nocardioides insulae]|uniref:MOSC domain-containing protein n=1 Tax=Nocardioides insulae TaxID=394734 RepID=UPI00041FBA41|nr:MOSC domain-containing protein [Nocardioides insulae]